MSDTEEEYNRSLAETYKEIECRLWDGWLEDIREKEKLVAQEQQTTQPKEYRFLEAGEALEEMGHEY